MQQKINLRHLTAVEQHTLYYVLKDNFRKFSVSLKSLSHIDIIEPQINFAINYLIKALSFPSPQALQAKSKNQIKEIVNAGIIQKNVVS